MEHWFRSTNNPALVAECERYRMPSDSPRAPTAQVPAMVAETVVEAASSSRVEEEATTRNGHDAHGAYFRAPVLMTGGGNDVTFTSGGSVGTP